MRVQDGSPKGAQATQRQRSKQDKQKSSRQGEFAGCEARPQKRQQPWLQQYERQGQPGDDNKVENSNTRKNAMRGMYSFIFTNFDVSWNERLITRTRDYTDEKAGEQKRQVESVERVACPKITGDQHLLSQTDEFDEAREPSNHHRGSE